ncbi:MAG: kinase-like domain-containing protein [Benniella sp.]|nr:MAG: kinase-like domain-containing protein [Benniella sp.]
MTPTLQPHSTSKRIPRSIDNGSYILQDILGVGAYGSVHRALDVHSGQKRAIKCLSNAGLNSKQRAFQTQEAELHGLVSGHPNIVTLHKVVEEDDCLFMVLDCGTEGDLFSMITERGGFVGNDAAIKSVFAQIASAVMHCHSKGVYHRDLKPENIIMFGSTSVKLIDFGLATSEPISTDFGCGSTFYLSPECQGGYIESVKSYDSAANDVWSLGVILINLVFGRNPWKQACARDDTFCAYVHNNNFLQTILPMSKELNEIIKAVFCLNPKNRITLSELAERVQACSSFTTSTQAPAAANGTIRAAVTTAAATTPIGSCMTLAEKRYVSSENKDQSQDSGVDLLSLA